MELKAIENPIVEMFDTWYDKMKEGKANISISMEASSTQSSFPYATFQMLGIASMNNDLTGNESSVEIEIQTDCYTTGKKAVTEVYEIDNLSNKIMREMGFYRINGGELVGNVDPSIKRVTSRYRRLYTGQL